MPDSISNELNNDEMDLSIDKNDNNDEINNNRIEENQNV